MTIRAPLVRVNGKIVELPAGDYVGGAPGNNGADGEGVPTGGTAGQVLAKIDSTDFNTEWITPSASGANVTVSDSAPGSPNDGDLWWKSDEGQLKIYYNDGSSSQWVDASSWGATFLGVTRKISKVVTTGSASTITFSSIPQTFTDLLVVVQGRDTAAGSTDLGMRLKINSDATAANYTNSEQFTGYNGGSSIDQGIAASTDGIRVGSIPGVSGNANAVGQVSFIIGNYSGSTFYKIVNGQCLEWTNEAGAALRTQHFGAVWKSTAAVTDLVLKAGGTAFVDGTTATLYGMG